MYGQAMIIDKEKQKANNDLTTAFARVSTPNLDEILKGNMYSSAHTEPVEVLKKLYPFQAITVINQYWYCELFPYFSTTGYSYFLPKLFAFFLECPNYLATNIYSSFEYYIMANVGGSPELKKWSRGLTIEQANIVCQILNFIESDLRKYKEPLSDIRAWKNLIKDCNNECE